MDANSWQRWLHVHRLVLILEHDTWVPSSGHSWDGGAGRRDGVRGRGVNLGQRKTIDFPCLPAQQPPYPQIGPRERGRNLFFSPKLGARRSDLTAHPSSQTHPQALAHPRQQWALQHRPVQDLALLADLSTSGLEQLCASRGLFLREAAVQVGTVMSPHSSPASSLVSSSNPRPHPYFLLNSFTPSLELLIDSHFSPVPQTSPLPPSTWYASFPRPRAWFFAWVFPLAQQHRPGIR